jgi:hypothetical protein
VKIPPREDDSAEAFRRQQDAIAEQVRAAKAAAIEKELQKIINNKGGE